MENKALGRGLAALLGDKETQVYKKPVPIFGEEAPKHKGDIFYLEINKIRPGKFQPREEFHEEKLKELTSSIKEKGLLQPILVRKSDSGFEIIAGERRFRAAKVLALERVPVIIKDVKDDDALIISLMENIQREQLNPIEEANAFQQLIDKFNFTQENIAQALGKDKTTISNILRLLKLPQEIKQSLIREEISLGHAKALLSIEDSAKQKKFCQLVISNSLSVRELENLINTNIPLRKRRVSLSKASDPHILELERLLQLALGTKVRIIAHKKRGKIVIEYYSLQDLERIINLLKKR